ncbi:MAG: pyridoxal 5'-phosphate synthase glutaminase subunit PdxT [Lachnospiraceae bacterium]|nr:pyridoxal 5'-phosphate synthase glutaminase subunit PdxT [Lachnospiraceae bacterium]
MKIGVLAVQGAFIEHEHMLHSMGIETLEIRHKKDLENDFQGIILPGGESTVMGKLLLDADMMETLKTKISQGFPVFGTCAGLILLAKEISGESGHLQTMDITVKRNAYGRQLGSFYTEQEFKGLGTVPMTFIRAPYIESVEKDTEVLATVDGNIVAARQKNQLVTAFHPELNSDTRIHQYFIDMIQNKI